MNIYEALTTKIKTLNIEVDKTATIKGAVTQYNQAQASKFNRANSATFRSEFFTYEGSDFQNVLEEFKNTSSTAFREDQTLIIKDTVSNKYQVYQNRDFEHPLEFSNEADVLSYLIPNMASTSSTDKATNKIYFGSPGTGKSNTVDKLTEGQNVRKTTFHPEYDYHSFVGGYKPTMDKDNNIIYTFVPQIFTNIYVEAWQNLDEHYYLQIEEINRGNCAEIFGDLFQLLDRDSDGFSKYDVDADEELKKYLISKLGKHHRGIANGKIKLPSNLSIIATMNTSDQSLFPMDSAFKRRWDWEYMKIDYNCDKSDFTIKLDNGNTYEWLKFLEAVNKLIFKSTGSPDKQIGNWFINATDTEKIIDEKTFINKVLFYLWNDVFKDEDESLFKLEKQTLIYEDFFVKNENSNLIVKIFDEHLKLTNKTEEASITEENKPA